MNRQLRDRLAGIAPWSGLIAAGAAWGMHQQVVSEALHFDCSATSDGTGIVLGLVALAIVFGGAIVSWRALPSSDSRSDQAAMRRFIVHMSVMAAMLSALGLGFLILASALLPGCPPS
jgi:hypothetical protein